MILYRLPLRLSSSYLYSGHLGVCPEGNHFLVLKNDGFCLMDINQDKMTGPASIS